MARIYKTSDRLGVQIDDIKITLSPLSFEQKCEIQAQLLTGNAMDMVRAARLAMKFSVKDIDGVEDSEGNPYKLSFDNGELSDDSIDDILNLQQQEKINLVCVSLLHGIPKELIDPNTGKQMAGVKIDKAKPRKKK